MTIAHLKIHHNSTESGFIYQANQLRKDTVNLEVESKSNEEKAFSFEMETTALADTAALFQI